MIKVRATKDGQKLYIKEISGEHNHELSDSQVRVIVYVTNVVICYLDYDSYRKYFVICRNKGVLILKKKKKQ